MVEAIHHHIFYVFELSPNLLKDFAIEDFKFIRISFKLQISLHTMESQGQAEYDIIFNVLETRTIPNLMNDSVKAIASNKSYDERLYKLQILASEMGNMYFTTYLQDNPNASIFEK